jgi:DNA-binding transcriptional MerR regulator
MKIGELAQLTHTSTRSLRHYEQQGLLTPVRLGNRYREYTRESIYTVQRIRWLLSAGLTTYVIRQVLPCILEEEPQEIRCPSLRRNIEGEMKRIESQANDLKKSASLLRDALGAGKRNAVPVGEDKTRALEHDQHTE